VLSIATGHDTRYLTEAVGSGREGYYTGAVAAGEPPGRWYGAGAERLGLAGTVDADLMESIYTHLRDPRDPATHDPATRADAEALAPGHRRYRSAEEVYAGLLEASPEAGPERRAELQAQAERSARQAVSFLDVTFSAPKSVTVLGVAFERAAADARNAGDKDTAAAWATHAGAVEEAVMAGARAAIAYLQDEAGYSRVGHHGGGAGRWIDAHEFVVAQFLQHDSRDRDPQLHVHQAILNRVLCTDGQWRTLDSRAIHAMRGAAAAVGERVMEAHLTRSLGVRFETRPDGRAREVLGVRQDVMDLFSSRRRAITAKTQQLVNAYTQRYGHEPNALQRTRLAQEATLATRRAKAHEGETTEPRLERWDAELRAEVGAGLTAVATDVLGRAQQPDPAAEFSVRDVLDRALARVAEQGGSFTRSDVVRAVSDELPGNLGLAPERVRELLDGLTDEALQAGLRHVEAADTSAWPEDLRLANGASVFEGPGSARYSTVGQLAADQALRDAVVERGAPTLTDEQADALVAQLVASGRELGEDQAAALRGVLTSGAQVEVLVAAAGTGKSFTVGALADAWTGRAVGDPGAQPGGSGNWPREAGERRVFGLAPSEVAAQVLAEDGLTTANTHRWLGAQRRLDTTRPGAPDRFGDDALRLRAGDLVVVDEAGMAGTAELAEIHQRCQAAGAKLLLVGDPRQLAAIGPGGTLADLAERGIRYELTDVRRFTEAWEGPASLRLRDGDRAALDEYVKHGRLFDAGTADQAEADAARAWLGDTVTGKESLLLVASNEDAARVGAALRAELVGLGMVHEAGVALGAEGAQGCVAGVGDMIQARHNAWELAGFEGNDGVPLNRQTFRVTGLRPDGGLTVERANGPSTGETLELPAGYVTEHVTLAYASTVHAAQGRTVDTSHAVVGTGMDAAAVYVALTRGRDDNTAWTVTRNVAEDTETGQTFEVEPRTARAVIDDLLETAEKQRSALTEQERAQQQARSTMTHLDQLIHVVQRVTAERTHTTLDALAADGTLSAAERARLAADEAMPTLEGLLRTVELAGHDPARVLADAARDDRGLVDAKSPAQVLHHRITGTLQGRLTPHLDGAADLIPGEVTDARDLQFLQDRADAADTRRHQLGAELAADPPRWALDALGPVPDSTDDPIARQEWEQRAGWGGAHRELADHQGDETDPLGAAPAPGMVEKAAVFRTAHEALGLVDVGAEEAGMSDGQLRARYQALKREETWAPRHVDDDLAVAHQHSARSRTDSAIWDARAGASGRDDEGIEFFDDASETAAADAEEAGRVAEGLEEVDQARARWYAETAVARDFAHRAGAELRARGIDPESADDRVTADEWIEAHRAEQSDADRHREITEDYELDNHDQAEDTTEIPDERPVETDVADIRDISEPNLDERSAPEPRAGYPSLDETAEDVARAQLALQEIENRRRYEQAAAETARSDELARWDGDDHAAGANASDADSESDERVLDR
jgi:conjugative relaxase-like TrwC/TraI family protein